MGQHEFEFEKIIFLMNIVMDLPEDVEQLIASMCETRERQALRSTSTSWRLAVDLSEDCNDEANSINGHTLSLASILKNGPVYMRCLKTIDLTQGHPCELVFDALEALNLGVLKKRQVSLYFNYDFCLDQRFLDFMASRRWHTILQTFSFRPIDQVPVALPIQVNAQKAILRGQHFLLFQFKGPLESLELVDSSELPLFGPERAAQECQILHKAFSSNTSSLCLHGILTDMSMKSLERARPNYELVSLELHFQGICTFSSASSLQRMCPNLKALKIKASNLTSTTMAYFDWLLWPHLKSLDLEHNYTLETFQLPRGLETLRVAFTGIRSLRQLYLDSGVQYSGLTSLSLDVSPLLYSDTMDFIQNHSGLQKLYLNLKNFMPKTIDIQRWSMFKNLQALELFFRQGLGINGFLTQIRQVCPNVHVTTGLPF